jgi:hypothetical protein
MPAATTTYKLGRDCINVLPGVVNDDIIDATINVSAADMDVTVFKATAITELVHMAGIIDITIDVNCTNVDGVVGDEGAMEIAGLDDIQDLNAVILDIQEKPNMKGKVEYAVKYGVTEA